EVFDPGKFPVIATSFPQCGSRIRNRFSSAEEPTGSVNGYVTTATDGPKGSANFDSFEVIGRAPGWTGATAPEPSRRFACLLVRWGGQSHVSPFQGGPPCYFHRMATQQGDRGRCETFSLRRFG